jgi:hypothetical protein
VTFALRRRMRPTALSTEGPEPAAIPGMRSITQACLYSRVAIQAGVPVLRPGHCRSCFQYSNLSWLELLTINNTRTEKFEITYLHEDLNRIN